MSFTNHTQQTKPRLLTVTESCWCHPRITISGDWLLDWGFAIGDRISLTWTEVGHMLMKIVMPRSEWREILQKKKLERSSHDRHTRT